MDWSRIRGVAATATITNTSAPQRSKCGTRLKNIHHTTTANAHTSEPIIAYIKASGATIGTTNQRIHWSTTATTPGHSRSGCRWPFCVGVIVNMIRCAAARCSRCFAPALVTNAADRLTPPDKTRARRIQRGSIAGWSERDNKRHGRCLIDAPPPLRLYRHVSLPLSAAHHGPSAPHRHFEIAVPAHEQSALQPRGALLGQGVRRQFRARRGHRHSDGIPVRHQLGGVLTGHGRRDRATARDGGCLFVLPRIGLFGIVSLWRAPAQPQGSLVDRLRRVRRLLALGLFHYCDGCLDA